MLRGVGSVWIFLAGSTGWRAAGWAFSAFKNAGGEDGLFGKDQAIVTCELKPVRFSLVGDLDQLAALEQASACYRIPIQMIAARPFTVGDTIVIHVVYPLPIARFTDLFA